MSKNLKKNSLTFHCVKIFSNHIFNSLHAGKSFMNFCCLVIFFSFKFNFVFFFCQECHESVKQFGSRSGLNICQT